MKDICKIFLLCLLFTSCSKKSEKVENLKIVDTISKIKTLKFEKSISVIFPAAFMRKKGWLNKYRNERDYFTPNEETVKYIEKKLPETSKIIENYWDESEWQRFLKIDAKHMDLYDKQYFGLVNSKNDSIVVIKLFNFESDPGNMKSIIEKDILAGGDGWWNTNYCDLVFNKNSKKFAARE